MPSTSETGHAKNVANLEDLISFCTGYGATYNPSKPELHIASLTTLLKNARTAVAEAKSAEIAFDNATNNRIIAFKPLKVLATRLINALDATNASNETVKDAKAINKKLQGKRATPKPAANSQPTPNAEKTISASQMSYDQQIEHFSKLIELLKSNSNYTPNETELQIPALNTNLENLKIANSAVVSSYTAWSNSRITRSNILYNPLSGLVALALDTKKYVKSIFGASSPQFKQVSGLEFKTIKS